MTEEGADLAAISNRSLIEELITRLGRFTAPKTECALFYIHPQFPYQREMRSILRMMGLPMTDHIEKANILFSPSLEKKPCIIPGHITTFQNGNGLVDNKIARLFSYRMRYNLARTKRCDVPLPLDDFKKNETISEIVQLIFKVALYNGYAVRFAWMFPNAARGVINYRIDVDDRDGETVKKMLAQIEPYSWCSLYFTTCNFVEDPSPIKFVSERKMEVGSHAHHHFTYEKDAVSNGRNVKRSVGFLRSIGMNVSGYVTPSAKHFRGMRKLLKSNGLSYTSNFGMLFDMLPFEMWDKGTYLEVPIHPLCPGNFIKGGKKCDISDQEMLEHHMSTATELSNAFLPVFLYGHNNENPKYSFLPDFLRFLEAFPDHIKMTLGEYAVFWKERLEKADPDNMATVYPDRQNEVVVEAGEVKRIYPFSVTSFLKSPLQLSPYKGSLPLRAKIMSYLEYEEIVPIQFIPFSLKWILKTCYPVMKRAYANSPLRRR